MKVSIAVCDDLEEERLQLIRMMQNYGRRHSVEFAMETFSGGTALLDAYRSGRWDFVLLDIYMPGQDGIEVARRLREQDSECILIFVTTSLEHGMVSYEL